MSDEDLRELERRWRESGSSADEEALRVAQARAGLALVVELEQRLGLEPAAEGRELVLELQQAVGGWRNVVVDLDRSDIVYSFTFGALLQLSQEVERAGGKLVLVMGDPKIRTVFDMLGLGAVLPAYASTEQACTDEGWTEADRATVLWQVAD